MLDIESMLIGFSNHQDVKSPIFHFSCCRLHQAIFLKSLNTFIEI